MDRKLCKPKIRSMTFHVGHQSFFSKSEKQIYNRKYVLNIENIIFLCCIIKQIMLSIVSTFVGIFFPHSLNVDNSNNKVYFLLYETYSA